MFPHLPKNHPKASILFSLQTESSVIGRFYIYFEQSVLFNSWVVVIAKFIWSLDHLLALPK